jgi:hypothetical protein
MIDNEACSSLLIKCLGEKVCQLCLAKLNRRSKKVLLLLTSITTCGEVIYSKEEKEIFSFPLLAACSIFRLQLFFLLLRESISWKRKAKDFFRVQLWLQGKPSSIV